VLFESVSERIPRGLPRGMRANDVQVPFLSLGIENSPEFAPEGFTSPAASGDEKGDTELND